MSEPKRYKVGKIGTTEMIDCVSYDDYVRLKAEVEVWKDMVADSGVACNERARENQDIENQIERLKAEVERLTKAGDAMAGSHITLIQVYLKDSSDEWHQELHNRWNAAKEGKQP